MENKEKYTIKPLVLDDRGNKEIEQLARKFKFRYLSRPNRGEMKKAGNLKYGYEKTHGEFMVIFDADFRPRHDFIEELLPYMQDKNMGIVQSPQFFDHDKKTHTRSMLECGAANVQTYFYKIIQASRDVFGGSICV
jgi:cellulose synthase (UDP-forming)